MTSLPEPISSWTELLSCFPDDIKSMMMSFVNQLSPLIDSVAIAEDQGEIEPNGFDGVGRFARYERLLLSEWALQEHHPDEFIRRAVAGEHLFHEMKKVEYKENRKCFALFDCGPEQLGKPRIVQLAILILLARRAEKSGASFQWGVIQDPNQKVYCGVSKESVLQWLQLRSVMPATQSLMNKCIEHYVQSNLDEDVGSECLNPSGFLKDFWLISKSELQSPAQTINRVSVNEPLLNPEVIDVGLDSGANKRSISLQVIQETLNVKIIRNPFNEKARASLSDKWTASGTWVLSSNGKRIGCKEQENNVGIHTLNPSNPKKTIEKSLFSTPKGQQVLGVYLAKKRVIVLSCDRDFFYFHNYPNYTQIKKVDKKQLIRQSGENNFLLRAVLYRTESGVDRFLILDNQGNLREISLSENKSLFSTKSENVLALGSIMNCDYYIEYDHANSDIIVYWYLGAYNPCRKTFKVQSQYNKPRVFVHGGGPWSKGSIGCLAYETDVDTWQLISGGRSELVNINSGDHVVGVLALSEKLKADARHDNRKKAVLVVVKNDLKSVFALSESGDSLLLKLGSEFTRGDINPRHPFLQYINSNNELVIVDLIKDVELLRLANDRGSNVQL